ncbi:MAG: hypothetical protein SGARI_005467, partial [Bacillariaceae sp.]
MASSTEDQSTASREPGVNAAAEEPQPHNMTVVSEDALSPSKPSAAATAAARSPSVPSDIKVKACLMAQGKVCICTTCEATRAWMMHRKVAASKTKKPAADTNDKKRSLEDLPE